MKTPRLHPAIPLLLLLLLAAACTPAEKDLFDESASARLTRMIEDTRHALTSAPHGWILNYQLEENGEVFPLHITFGPNSQVTVSAQNKYFPTYTTATSTYNVIRDMGPVLTFDTHNDVLHLFSYPKDPEGGSSLNGIGLKGDYEFIVIEVEEGKIRLKGKKWGVEMEMRGRSEE